MGFKYIICCDSTSFRKATASVFILTAIKMHRLTIHKIYPPVLYFTLAFIIYYYTIDRFIKIHSLSLIAKREQTRQKIKFGFI